MDKEPEIFFDRIARGDVKWVKQYLKEGNPLYEMNRLGESPLHVAIKHRKIAMMKLLLQHMELSVLETHNDLERTPYQIAEDYKVKKAIALLGEVRKGRSKKSQSGHRSKSRSAKAFSLSDYFPMRGPSVQPESIKYNERNTKQLVIAAPTKRRRKPKVSVHVGKLSRKRT